MAVKFCVIIVLLLQWQDVTQGSGTNPDFNFTCSMAGDVVITVSGDYDHYAVQNVATDQDVHLIPGAGTCEKKLTGVSTGDKITLTGCDRKLPIYLYLMKTGTYNVIGGHSFHEYKLSCDLTSDGKDETVDKGFVINGVPPAPTPKNEQPEVTLKMAFNPANATIGTAIAVKITDESVATEYKSNENHYVVPQNCTASATDRSGGKVNAVIYNLANTRRDFFEDTFASGTVKEATAVLHAFKFDVASNNVQVSCNVKICPTATCKAAKRRRRSVMDDEGTLHEVTGTFQIVSKSDNSSSAGDRADVPRLLSLLTMFAACILRQMFH